MKKIIISVIITAIVCTGGTALVMNTIAKPKEKTVVLEQQSVGINKITEVEYNIPGFSIITKGIKYNNILSGDLQRLKTYEVTVNSSDGVYNYVNTYHGIKLKDVFEVYEIKDYQKAIMKSNGGLQVTYNKDEITDNMFLVFDEDGFSFPAGEYVMLLNPDLYTRFSVRNLMSIDFE